MANYSQLKAAIADVIKTNGTKAITGQVLQDVLNSIVSVIGANYTFAGIATPSTNPSTPDQNVVYIASQAGTYTNFGGIELPAGISLLMWNGVWESEILLSIEDGVIAIGVDSLTIGGSVYNILGANKIIPSLDFGGKDTEWVYYNFIIPSGKRLRMHMHTWNVSNIPDTQYVLGISSFDTAQQDYVIYQNMLFKANGINSLPESIIMQLPNGSEHFRISVRGDVGEKIHFWFEDDIEINQSSSMNDNIANGIFTMHKDWTLYGTDQFVLPDNIVLEGNGHTINVLYTQKIVVGENTCIRNVHFMGDANWTRTLKPSSGGKIYYNYTPSLTFPYDADYVSICGLDSRPLISIKGNNSSIKNCIFEQIDGCAVRIINEPDRLDCDNVLIDGCAFEFCYGGIYNKGEFNRFNNIIAHGCLIGFTSNAGNFVMSNSIFKMNDIGVCLYDNGNGGHSTINGCEFAHNERGLQIPKKLERDLGMVVCGCHFADSPIQGWNVNSFLLIGCRLDFWLQFNNMCLSNAAHSNIIRDTYATRDERDIFDAVMSLKLNIAMTSDIQDSDINN